MLQERTNKMQPGLTDALFLQGVFVAVHMIMRLTFQIPAIPFLSKTRIILELYQCDVIYAQGHSRQNVGFGFIWFSVDFVRIICIFSLL